MSDQCSGDGGSTLTVWLAGAPERARDGALTASLVEDLLTLLQPHGVTGVWTSEPRTYRASPRGLAQLRAAIEVGRVTSVVMSAEPGRTAGDATGRVDFTSRQQYLPAVQVGARIAAPGAAIGAMVEPLAQFVQRWAERLEAGAAFLSTDPDDGFLQTRYERERLQGTVFNWAAVRRYARGVFWGMLLGPDLCGVLGGLERVQAEAPVDEARRLGEGLWLQVSAVPPPPEDALQRLEAYLQPLLGWTRDDLTRLGQPRPTPGEARPPGTSIVSMARPQGTRRERVRPHVSVQYLGPVGVDTGLHVHLAAPPSASEREVLVRLVGDWYTAGVLGQFGGAGFHDLMGPSEEATVLHWRIDLGSADGPRAIHDLAARLGALPSPGIERLVVGTERVG